MARGAAPGPIDSSRDSAAADTLPPFSPFSPTMTSTTAPTFASHTPPPSEPPTSDMELLRELNAERERRYRVESALAITKAELISTQDKLAAAEGALKELRGRHWTSHMMQGAGEMGPGEALIATVAAPVMVAPLAAATVVKGFQSVGTGIASLFTKGKGKGNEATKEDGKDETQPTATQPNDQNIKMGHDFSFYAEAQQQGKK